MTSNLSSGEVRTVPAYENGNDRAGMFLELDYYASPGRGAVPSWTNAMAEFSRLYWLTFDGLSAASRVSVPALFVHSDGCVLPGNAKALRDRLAGPAELVWAEGSQDRLLRSARPGLAGRRRRGPAFPEDSPVTEPEGHWEPRRRTGRTAS